MTSKDPYLSSRTEEFDSWRQMTREALERPGVQEKLGELSARLLILSEEAFLPNVRGSAVSVPRQYRDTDSIAILPYFPGFDSSSLMPDRTMLEPSISRRIATREALAVRGLKHSRRATSRYIRGAIDAMPDYQKRGLVSPGTSVPIHTGAIMVRSEHKISIPSRTVTTFDRAFLFSHSELRRAVLVHELIHAHDQGALQGPATYIDQVRAELRGYYGGSVVVEDAIETGDLSRTEYELHDRTTNIMENIRRECNIAPEELIRVQAGPLTNEDDAAFQLQFVRGII